jgi:hypothetical protein
LAFDHVFCVRSERGEEGTEMTTVQAFLFGMMVAWTPSLLVLAWLLLRVPPEDPAEFDVTGGR